MKGDFCKMNIKGISYDKKEHGDGLKEQDDDKNKNNFGKRNESQIRQLEKDYMLRKDTLENITTDFKKNKPMGISEIFSKNSCINEGTNHIGYSSYLNEELHKERIFRTCSNEEINYNINLKEEGIKSNSKHMTDIKKELTTSEINKKVIVNEIRQENTSNSYRKENKETKYNENNKESLSFYTQKCQSFFYINTYFLLYILITNIQKVKCSFIVSIFSQVDDRFDPYAKKIQYITLGIIGIYLSLFGVKYLNFSLFILLTIAFDVFFDDLIVAITKIDTSKNFILNILKSPVELVSDFSEKNPHKFGIIILVCAIIVSYLIVSITKAFSYIGFFIITLFVYKEGFHKKAVVYFELNDLGNFAGIFMFIAMIVVLYVAFMKGPLIVFTALFSFVGPIIFFAAFSLGLNIKSDFKDFVEAKITDFSKVREIKEFVHLFIVSCVCFFFQFFVLIRKKKS